MCSFIILWNVDINGKLLLLVIIVIKEKLLLTVIKRNKGIEINRSLFS